MQTSLKISFAQISLAAQNSKLPKFWGAVAPQTLTLSPYADAPKEQSSSAPVVTI